MLQRGPLLCKNAAWVITIFDFVYALKEYWESYILSRLSHFMDVVQFFDRIESEMSRSFFAILTAVR